MSGWEAGGTMWSAGLLAQASGSHPIQTFESISELLYTADVHCKCSL